MTDQNVPVECGCAACSATGEAVMQAIAGQMGGGYCSHSILDGAIRAVADSAAILVKPGSEEKVRDYLVALLAARFDRTVIRNAEIERRNAGVSS
ncbi:hypothetical protein ACWGM0_17720 [Sphingomonas bisphenolicum]